MSAADKIDLDMEDPTEGERAARVARSSVSGYSPVSIEITDAGGSVDLAAIATASQRTTGPREYVEAATRGDGRTGIAPDGHPVATAGSDEAIALMRTRAADQRERDRVAKEAAALAERAAAEQARVEAEQARADAAPLLHRGDLVAGGAAEGHGVAFGWRGKGDMTRGQITAVLVGAGLPADWTREPVGPEGQASRALATLRADGYTVRPEKKKNKQTVEAKEYDARWMVDAPNHGAAVGERSGDVVLVATLVGNELELDGDKDLAAKVLADYAERLASELCKSSDITTWLQETMVDKLDAVRMGLGWYVPRANAELGKRLCNAFEKAGWGDEECWTEIPVASGEQLRVGLLKGLAFEVKAVIYQLERERETAKTSENREDIGNKRAATFLGDLKKVGRRVVAYGALLGADKVETLRLMIHDAIVTLESSLSEDDKAIVARFQNLWEEIERDRAKAGGVL